MIRISIEGRPTPWAAPYVGKRGAFSKHTIRKQEAKTLLSSRFDDQPWEGAINLKLVFFFKVPKSTSQIKKDLMLNGSLHCTKRPDLSNCVKFIEDVCTGILWKDDSQVISLHAEKIYSSQEATLIIMS